MAIKTTIHLLWKKAYRKLHKTNISSHKENQMINYTVKTYTRGRFDDWKIYEST